MSAKINLRAHHNNNSKEEHLQVDMAVKHAECYQGKVNLFWIFPTDL